MSEPKRVSNLKVRDAITDMRARLARIPEAAGAAELVRRAAELR